MGLALERRQGDLGRRRRHDAGHRFRTPQGRRRQRHPAAEGRPHRRDRRRRRPHRLVPDRSGHASNPSCSRTSTSSATPSIAGAMPKSAFSANAQAKVCAAAVAKLLAGSKPDDPKLINTCYSLVAPDYGISVAGVYRPADGQLKDVEGAGGVSPINAPPAFAGAGSAHSRMAGSTRSRQKFSAERSGASRLRDRCSAAARCSTSARPAQVPTGAASLYSGRRCHPGTAHRRRRATRNAGAPSSSTGRSGLCLLCHSGPVPGGAVPGHTGARSQRRRRALVRRPVAVADRRCAAASTRTRSCRPTIVSTASSGGSGIPGQADLTAEQIEDVVAYLATLRDEQEPHDATMMTRIPARPGARLPARHGRAGRRRRTAAAACDRTGARHAGSRCVAAIRKVVGERAARKGKRQARPAAADRERQLGAARRSRSRAR